MKKIISVLLAVFLLLTASLTVSAQTTSKKLSKTPTITSKNGLWKYEGNILAGYCGKEESITLPKKVDGIEMYGIGSIGNNNVKHINIPINYTRVFAFAFGELQELRSVTFSQEYSDDYKMTRFDDAAFADCPKLEKVVLPNRMVESTFYDGDLKEKIYGGVLPSESFRNCPSLMDVTFPERLIKVGSSAFRGCTSIEKIVIPDGVEVIAVNAFKDTPSLKTLVLPDSIEEGGLNGAFNGVSSSTTVVCSSDGAAAKEIEARKQSSPSLYQFSVVSSTNSTVDGDINKDEKFNIKDVTHLQKYLALVVTEETVNTDKIDFNGDGNVNIIDCTLMQKALAKE